MKRGMISDRDGQDKWQFAFKDPYDGSLRSILGEIEQEAIAAGARNHPPTDAMSPDPTELRIKSLAESLRRQCDQYFFQKITDLKKSFDELGATADLETRRAEIRATLDGSQTRLATAVTEEKPTVLNLTKKYLENQAALNGFIADHQLIRPAFYPESGFAHYMWVVSTAIFEAIASFLFYVEKREPLTALTTSFLAGGIVVSMSVLLGNFFRFKNHNDPRARIFGWIVCPIWFGILICLSKLLSFYRDNPDINTLGIFTILLNWNISPEAWLMFMFTILVGSFGFWKGYQSDDPMPGYGRASRATDEAKATLDEAIANIRVKTKQFVEHQSRIITEFESDVQYRARNIRRVLNDLHTVNTAIQTNLSSIARDFNHAISVYQARNSSVRTANPPAYFQIHQTLDDHSRALESLQKHGQLSETATTLENFAANLVNITKNMRHTVAEISETQDKLLDSMIDETRTRATNEISRSNFNK